MIILEVFQTVYNIYFDYFFIVIWPAFIAIYSMIASKKQKKNFYSSNNKNILFKDR